jgi:hypothetical protein
MPRLFGRKYEFVIGPSGQEGRVFTELEIRFKVEKTGDSAPNKAEIQLVNLDEDSIKFVTQKDLAINLSAGYKENFGLIFAGRTTFSHTVKGPERHDDKIRRGFEQRKKEEADRITVITAHDGLKALKKYITLSLANDNLTETAVLREVVKKVGISLNVSHGTLKALKDTKIFHGAVISSFFKDYMDLYTHNHGLRWNICNEVLNIYPIGGTVSSEIIQLDVSSGLEGSPEPIERGYKISSKLRHDIDIGTGLYVESELIKEQFSAVNVTHAGDLYGSEWNTTAECMPV